MCNLYWEKREGDREDIKTMHFDSLTHSCVCIISVILYLLCGHFHLPVIRKLKCQTECDCITA